jgi:hypothetical protein
VAFAEFLFVWQIVPTRAAIRRVASKPGTFSSWRRPRAGDVARTEPPDVASVAGGANASPYDQMGDPR